MKDIPGQNPDSDLDARSREELVEMVKLLRAGIREHRDASGHDLCWHHPKLWNLLPERTDPKILVPDWADFIKGCAAYRKSLDETFQKDAGKL
jgi:hypothetical protein